MYIQFYTDIGYYLYSYPLQVINLSEMFGVTVGMHFVILT